MVYTGNICDGCGNAFKEGDDIVVCPECATPQHRECYEKNNKCVNGHLHAEGFEWKSTVVQPKVSFFKKEEQKEFSACPNCGHKNPKGSKQCEKCGMKLMVFGIDIALTKEEQEQEEKQISENKNSIPHYEAPFTLGVGEGFEEETEENKKKELTQKEIINKIAEKWEENQDSDNFDEDEEISAPSSTPPAAEQLQREIIGNVEATGHNAYYDSYVDGIHMNLLATLIGINAYTYIDKFKKMELGKKVSFNWAAFFFAPYWFFYRKLYKAGIIIMTVLLAISISFTPIYINMMESYAEKAEIIFENMPGDIYSSPEEFSSYFESMTEEEIAEYSEQMLSIMMDLFAPVLGTLFILIFVVLLVHLISGFIADKLYKKQTMANAKSIVHAKNKAEVNMLIAKYAGTSMLSLFGALIVNQIISMMASYLMYGA